MSVTARDTDSLRSDLGLEWDLTRLEWFRAAVRSPYRPPEDAERYLREIGESGLRRLFEADEIDAAELETLFGRLLRSVAVR